MIFDYLTTYVWKRYLISLYIATTPPTIRKCGKNTFTHLAVHLTKYLPCRPFSRDRAAAFKFLSRCSHLLRTNGTARAREKPLDKTMVRFHSRKKMLDRYNSHALSKKPTISEEVKLFHCGDFSHSFQK